MKATTSKGLSGTDVAGKEESMRLEFNDTYLHIERVLFRTLPLPENKQDKPKQNSHPLKTLFPVSVYTDVVITKGIVNSEYK